MAGATEFLHFYDDYGKLKSIEVLLKEAAEFHGGTLPLPEMKRLFKRIDAEVQSIQGDRTIIEGEATTVSKDRKG